MMICNPEKAIDALKRILKKVPHKVSPYEAADMAIEFQREAKLALDALDGILIHKGNVPTLRFEAGMRIRFYGLGWLEEADQSNYCADMCVVIEEVPAFVGSENYVMWRVVNPRSSRQYLVHPKQCRKLVRKKS